MTAIQDASALHKTLAATLIIWVAAISVVLIEPLSPANASDDSVEVLLDLMVPDKIGTITKPDRPIRISLITADGVDELREINQKFKKINDLVKREILYVEESITNANWTPSRRVAQDVDAVVIVGYDIMNTGIGTFRFHITDFIKKYSAKKLPDILRELATGDYQCKLYRWNKGELKVDKFLMIVDYSYEKGVVKKCETLLTLNMIGIFAKESDIAGDQRNISASEEAIKLEPQVKHALRVLYSQDINRGDSRGTTRDKLRSVSQ